jgi:hypothetical protein
MGNITLSEQMGAMGVVDELRHRQLLVQDLLNLPERRTEVVRRLSDYYQSRNIEVSSDVLDKGVKEYFSKRLMFDAPKLGLLSLTWAALVISRRVWVPRTILVCLFCVVSFSLGSYAFKTHQEGVVASLFDTASILKSSSADLTLEILDVQVRITRLASSLSDAKLPAANRMLLIARASAAEAEQLNVIEPLKSISYESRHENQQTLDSQSARLDQAYDRINSAKEDLNSAIALIAVNEDLSTTVAGSDYQSMKGRYPALPKAAAEAERLINQASTESDLQAARKAVAALTRLLSDSVRVQATETHLDQVIADFNAMKLRSKSDYSLVNLTADRAREAIKGLDIRGAESVIDELESMKSYALTPFQLRVVDRTGIKSGAERIQNGASSGQGKAWYLIVEAVDPTGRVVPLKITSSESGQTREVKYFGLRVSSDEYQRVKADKQADGKVDQRDMGSKGDRTFEISYSDRAHPSHNMILEW